MMYILFRSCFRHKNLRILRCSYYYIVVYKYLRILLRRNLRILLRRNQNSHLCILHYIRYYIVLHNQVHSYRRKKNRIQKSSLKNILHNRLNIQGLE